MRMMEVEWWSLISVELSLSLGLVGRLLLSLMG